MGAATVRRGRLVAGAAVLAAVVAAAVAAGVVGDGDGSDAPSSEAGSTTATVAAADAPFCEAFGALLVGPLADPATDASDPAQLQGAVVLTEALLESLERSAPREVAVSASALAAQYRAAFAVFERYGHDLRRVAAEATEDEQAVLDAFGTAPAEPGSSDPFTELERFVADRCAPGVTVPPELMTTLPPATSP